MAAAVIAHQQVNHLHLVTVKTAALVAAAAIQQAGQGRVLVVQLRKAIAAGLRVTAPLAAMAILMALQTPLAAVVVAQVARVLRLRFKLTQQAAMAALRTLVP